MPLAYPREVVSVASRADLAPDDEERARSIVWALQSSAPIPPDCLPLLHTLLPSIYAARSVARRGRSGRKAQIRP